MFKIRNTLLPYNILELFSSSLSNYNLRNSDFQVQRVKSVKYGKHSVRFFGPFLWSKLSMKDRNETSLSRFKANIRRKDLRSEGLGSELSNGLLSFGLLANF